MRSNKNKTVFNEAHLQNIKRKIEEKTGVQLNPKNEAFKPVRILRKPATIIALMICFVMLASATVAVIYQTQYIPGKGFVESGEYEVYYTPEILKLGKDAVVETVTRVKDGKTSELSIIITDSLDKNLKIITAKYGEFDLTPTVDYNYSSFGTMGKFQFNNAGDYSSYGYLIKDFPDINEFTLVNNGESIEVKLAPSNPDDVLTAEDSAVTVRFYKMSKGSKVLAYEIEDNNFNITLSFNNTMSKMTASKTADLGYSTFKLYGESGNEIKYYGYDTNPGERCGQYILFLRTRPEEKINKITIDSVIVDINIRPYTIFLENNLTDTTQEYSIDIPVPKDGEEIILDERLLLYDHNGLTSKLKSVIRKGNRIIIYTETEYAGEEYIGDIENIDICFTDLLGGATMTGWGFDGIAINGDEDFITIRPSNVRFFVNGNWEIKFAD